jgi:hypothetical protein
VDSISARFFVLLYHNFGAHCSIVGFQKYLNNPALNDCLPTKLTPVAIRISFILDNYSFYSRG